MTAQVKEIEVVKRIMGKGPVIRILMIEDSESDVILFEHLLEEEAAKENTIIVADVARIADAFPILHEESFDLIMLDLNVLDIQGIGAVAAIRAEAQEVPVIVYSGMDDPRLFKEALLCGAHSYLVKGRETGHSIKKIIDSALGR
jgi:two-component system, sensor histidine kinase and response regulator